MELQSFFYTVAIIFMILAIGLILMIAVIFFLLYKKVSALQEFLVHKVAGIAAPVEIAAGVGTAVARTALRKVKDMIAKE